MGGFWEGKRVILFELSSPHIHIGKCLSDSETSILIFDEGAKENGIVVPKPREFPKAAVRIEPTKEGQ